MDTLCKILGDPLAENFRLCSCIAAANVREQAQLRFYRLLGVAWSSAGVSIRDILTKFQHRQSRLNSQPQDTCASVRESPRQVVQMERHL